MKSKTGATLLLIGTFILGAVTGAVSYSLYRTHVQPAQAAPASRSSHNIVEELAKGLNLDQEQQEKLKVIIAKSRDRYGALRAQFRPQYQAIRTETRQEMRQILREDQKSRFEEIMREIDSRHKGQGPSR